MKPRLVPTASSALIAFSFFVASVPTASAQQEKPLSVLTEDGVISPEFLTQSYRETGFLRPEYEVLHVRFFYQVEIPVLSFCVSAITMQYEARALGVAAAVSNIVLSPSSESKYYTSPGLLGVPATVTSDRLHGFSTRASITLTKDAPALEDLTFEVTAFARVSGQTQSGCNLTDSSPFPIQFTVRPAYQPHVTYEQADTVIFANPRGEAALEIRATNLGNGVTRVRTTPEIIGQPKCLDMIISPPEIVLLSRAFNPNNEVSAPLKIEAFGVEGASCSVKVTLTATSDSSQFANLQEDVQQLYFTIYPSHGATEKGRDAATLPGFDPLLLMVGLAALGLVYRRR